MRYHFMGIGGYGMSGLAYLLAKRGEEVTGCDVVASSRVRRLEEEGVRVFLGHSPAHLEGVDVLVYSTDIPPEEEERREAAARGLAVRHRSEILSLFVNAKKSVAVTGSHGKSTVTAMAGLLLEQAGLDPVVVVGAEVPAFGGTARAGRGEWVVAEADESDGSFLRYRPLCTVLTNLEPEHLDHYGGDFRALKEALRCFARECVRPQGFIVACADDPALREILSGLERPVIWYGFSPQADYRAEEVEAGGGGLSFHLLRRGERMGRVRLEIPGRHNAQNATGVAALGLTLGLPFELVARALAAYRGAGRRFQVVGRPDGITVVDDYAHHPTEIRATLEAARERGPARIIAVFQPQRYSRTRLLMEEFSRAFSAADEVFLLDIYSPPGEKPIPGVSSQALAERISAREGRPVTCFSDQGELVKHLSRRLEPGDLVLTMGAGDVWKVAHRLVQELSPSALASVPTGARTGAPKVETA